MLSYLEASSRKVEAALKTFLPTLDEKASTLHRAMHYSLFAGGKRLRPALAFAAAEACGGNGSLAVPSACAVECVHTYSLIHDDLPCMDDDDLRRGCPTCHKVFGEAVAVLAGDALLTIAFQILCETPVSPRYPLRRQIRELAVSAGSRWLIGGQVQDMEAEGKETSASLVRAIHLRKTAAMMRVALRLGAMAANAEPWELRLLSRFGVALGLAFQTIDDILDVTQTQEKLGKSAGKDERAGKATLPGVLGLEVARRKAQEYTRKALDTLVPLGARGESLRSLTEFLLRREF